MSSRDHTKPFDLQLDHLLHPASAFAHPRDVLEDPDLTKNEKRAILAAWASDACAVDAVPALRLGPRGRAPVAIDEIFDALRDLDKVSFSRPLLVSLTRGRALARRKRRHRSGGGRLSA